MIMTFCLILQAPAQELELVESFEFFEDSKIVYNTERPYLQKLYRLEEGEYTVFEYRSNNGGDPGNHSNGEVVWAFQIDSELESFELNQDQIKEALGLYNQLCRCQDKGINKISSGSISGIKKPNGWLITIDVIASGRKTSYPYSFTRSTLFTATVK